MSKSQVPWARWLAEGLVIIAGVLIALAGDRFVQGLDEDALEQAYLNRLLVEFEQAEIDLDDAARRAEGRQDGIETFLAALSVPTPDSISSRDIALGMALSYWLFDPRMPREAWDDLVATGRMGLIESEALRSNIAVFYRLVAQQSEFHAEWRTFVLPFRREVNSVLSPQLQLAIARNEIEDRPIPPGLLPDRAALLQAIRARPTLVESAGDVLVTGWTGGWQYRELAARAAGVADQIRAELESR